MLKNYEIVMIITPLLYEEKVKKLIIEYKNFLKEKKGILLYTEYWGLKKFAYSIQKKKSGFFYLFEYKLNPIFISDLELKIRKYERILRFLNIKLDKNAMRFYKKKRKQSQFVQSIF